MAGQLFIILGAWFSPNSDVPSCRCHEFAVEITDHPPEKLVFFCLLYLI